MTHLIDIDASQPGITRDNNICAGETHYLRRAASAYGGGDYRNDGEITKEVPIVEVQGGA